LDRLGDGWLARHDSDLAPRACGWRRVCRSAISRLEFRRPDARGYCRVDFVHRRACCVAEILETDEKDNKCIRTRYRKTRAAERVHAMGHPHLDFVRLGTTNREIFSGQNFLSQRCAGGTGGNFGLAAGLCVSVHRNRGEIIPSWLRQLPQRFLQFGEPVDFRHGMLQRLHGGSDVREEMFVTLYQTEKSVRT
jgi:hypothetical protein